MAIILNDKQLILLSAASQREDHALTPLTGARSAAARKAATRLLAEGFVREVRARGEAPVWRRDDETGRAFALKLSAAGLKAIAAGDEDRADAGRRVAPLGDDATPPATSARASADGKQASVHIEAPAPAPKVAPRSGTKIEAVVTMLSRSEGASIDAIVAATGWQPHTTRAALTGLRQRGYAIERVRQDAATRYRLGDAGAPDSIPQAEAHKAATPSEGDHLARQETAAKGRRTKHGADATPARAAH